MKELKKYGLLLVLYLTLAYYETFFKLVSNYSLTLISYLDILLISIFLFSLLKLFPKKVEKVLFYVIISIIYFFYGVQICVYSLFGLYFDFSILSIAGQVGAFWKEGIFVVLGNWWKLLLLFIPILLTIIFHKFINYEEIKYRYLFVIPMALILAFFLFIPRIDQKTEVIISNYDVLTCFFNDFKAKPETELVTVDVEEEETEPEAVIKDYEYDIDFDSLESNNSTITKLNNYFANAASTSTNDETGYFEGKNLILILAESFNEIGIHKDLTPTLYKMQQEGFQFNNYYSSSYNSTVGGEFQLLNSMYASSSSLGTWKAGTNSFPFSSVNLFKQAGYSTYAYHDNDYDYMNRDTYLKAYGFDNFTACYNGLEDKMACAGFPESDLEMMEATVDDYINEDQFFTYYVTVSGHGPYTLDTSRNTLDYKYYDYVQSMGYDYSEDITCYLASMVELDKAMEYLINRLDEMGKLEDTVIVMVGDHYPYYLEDSEYEEYLGRAYEVPIEVSKNSLIVYNPDKPALTCDKVGQTMDVLPTLYNLFGIDFDSRLIIGKDMFSNATGMALFGNGSWVSDEGTYYANTGEFVSNQEVSEERYQYLMSYADTQMAMTDLIFDSDYYGYIKQYLNQ